MKQMLLSDKDIIQETGNSVNVVMSQKAITDVFENTFEVHKCPNLFNEQYTETESVDGLSVAYVSGVAAGYTVDDNGKVVESAGEYITYPIKVEVGTTVYFKGMTTQSLMGIGYGAFYDKDMTFISKLVATNGNLTVPNNAVYLRLISTSNTTLWFTKSMKMVTADNNAGYVSYHRTYYTTLDEPLRTEYEATESKKDAVNALSHEYLVRYVESLTKELNDLRDYVREKNPPTVLDSGKCGENLTWTLYSDGLLKISGTGRAYDYCKGLVEGLTREEIESKVANGTMPEYYAFQEGKTYDDENGQYAAPWYKYRPETDFVNYTNEETYNAHNPNGYKYNRIEIDKGITYLGDWMFYRVCGVANLTVPEGVTVIGRWCIRYCTSLITISLPDSLTTIEEYGISRQEMLKAIKFGNSLVSFGENGMLANPLVESLVLPDTMTTAGAHLCEANPTLKYAYLGGLTEIPMNMLTNCKSLEEVVIPATVTKIGYQAFYGCDSLTVLHIPELVTEYTPSYHPNLREVYVDSPTMANTLGMLNYGMDGASKPKYVNIREDITAIHKTFLSYYTKCGTFKGYTKYVYSS